MSLVLTGFASCTEEEKYDSGVVREINITCDDEPWSIYYGTSNKPLFLYAGDGSYFSNYSSLYPFKLDNGSYKIVATTQSALLTIPDNIEDVVIPQDTLAKQAFAISAPVEYSIGNPLDLNMHTRTGVLRLKAIDSKADKRYSTVRAVVTSQIAAYKISDASFVNGKTVLVRDKATSNGGINYTDDFVLLDTETNGSTVNVRIDYVDNKSNVIQSKTIDGDFTILPNDTVQVSFALNNADEPMIQDFSVQIASEGWTDLNIFPGAPVVVPDGYTYVSPNEDINSVYNTLKNDASLDAVKLYLKAGTNYTFSSGTLGDMDKSLYILGQQKIGKSLPTLTIGGNISMKGTLDAIHFENLNINRQDRFFKLKNQAFVVNEILFRNCWFDNFSGTMWYQETNANYQQVVNNWIFDSCRFINLQLANSPLIGPSTKVIAPIYGFTFKNTTFHITSLVSPIVSGLKNVDKKLTVDVENCTIINNASESKSIFEFNGNSTEAFNFTAKNNLFSGSNTGIAPVFALSMESSQVLDENYTTSDFVPVSWGLSTAPTPLDETMSTLFKDAVSGDMTIKTNSSVYTKKIGDNYWIK